MNKSFREEILQKLVSFERLEIKIDTIVVNPYHEQLLKKTFSKEFKIIGSKGTLFNSNVILDKNIEEVQFLTREEMIKRQEKMIRKAFRIKTQKTILKEKIEKVTKSKIEKI